MDPRQINIDDLRPWIEFEFARSSGPGGQNVNKVNTRATLLFDFNACTDLTDPQRKRLRARLHTRLSSDGRLRVVSQRGRTQGINRDLAEARLVELLREALHVPKKRRPTRPSRGARERRLREKKMRGEKKRLRQSP